MNTPDRPARTSRGPGADESRIAILVLGCLGAPYGDCVRAIRRTWAALPVDGADVYYVYGTRSTRPGPGMARVEDLIGGPAPALTDDEVRVFGDVILCGCADLVSDDPDCILRKRLGAFAYLADEARYDFVYTVCATSYVDVAELNRYVAGLPRRGVYQGPLAICQNSGFPFVSGASLLMSRDIAADLAGCAESIVAANDGAAADDVAMGRWIAERYGGAPLAEICRRIAAQERVTDNQTFVLPNKQAMANFVHTPIHGQRPRGHTYHYHFHKHRIWQMEDFHRRHFTAAARYALAPGVAVTRNGDDTILYGAVEGKNHICNASATAIVDLLASGSTFDETIGMLLASYDVDRETLERDALTLIDELLATGLIVGAP